MRYIVLLAFLMGCSDDVSISVSTGAVFACHVADDGETCDCVIPVHTEHNVVRASEECCRLRQ